MGGRGGRKISKARSGGKVAEDKPKNERESENNGPSSSGNLSDGLAGAVGLRRSERLRKLQKGKPVAEETPRKKSRTMKAAESDGGNEERKIRESEHLLNIFPEEIWRMIAKVAVPETLENLSNSSPFFRNILLADRVRFLFPSVFQIMAPNIECDIGDEDYYIFLKLRLVSSSWTNAIDDYYLNQLNRFGMVHDPDDGVLINSWKHAGWVFKDDVYTFEGNRLQEFDKFNTKFEATHATSDRSPFITRVLELEEGCGCCRGSQTEEEHCRVFWNAITNLLLKFGHHIWYCSITIRDKCPTPTTYYSKLSEWLSLMPNLKTLYIRYSRPQDSHYNEVDLTRNELSQLQAEAEKNALPKLDNLRFLKTDNLPTPIFNALLVSNDHISMLEVDRSSIHLGYNIYTVPLPNLKKLSLKLCSAGHLKDLAAAQVDWALTSLYLPMKIKEKTAISFRLWLRLFEVVSEKFGAVKTLTNLMFQLPNVMSDGESYKIIEGYSAFKLNLGHVARLKLLLGTRCPLDFLLPMKDSLQKLEITIDRNLCGKSHKIRVKQAEAEEKQAVQLLGFENRMSESNIWSLFPNLNKLMIEDECIWGHPIMHTRQN